MCGSLPGPASFPYRKLNQVRKSGWRIIHRMHGAQAHLLSKHDYQGHCGLLMCLDLITGGKSMVVILYKI